MVFKKKLLFALFVVVCFAFISVSWSFAKDAKTTTKALNEQTGAESENIAQSAVESVTSVENSNQAEVVNDISSTGQTGGNTGSYNSGDGIIKTGETKIEDSIKTEINSNVVEASANDSKAVAENKTTGADSANEATSTIKETINLENINETTIDNKIETWAETGDNTATYNTGDGKISTGSGETEIELENDFDTNDTFVDTSGFESESEAGNYNTGYGSENKSLADITNSYLVESYNQTKVTNSISATSNTGGNDCSYTTGNCEIETGYAQVKIGVENEGGRNETTIGEKKGVPTPTATPTPTVTPTVTPNPTPAGGILLPSVTVTPTVTPKPETKKDEVRAVVEEILEKVAEVLETAIPKVEAAAPLEEAEVLGVIQLPITGIGEMGPGISLVETLLGFGLLGLGMRLRLLLENKEKKEKSQEAGG